MDGQGRRFTYTPSAFFTSFPVEDLSRLLIQTTNGEMQRAFFVTSGSAAVEAALKYARQFHLEKVPPEPSRTHFISRRQSYHGSTLGALSVSGHDARRNMFEPMLGVPSSRVGPCYAYRTQDPAEPESTYVYRLEAELEAEFCRIGPSNVAAFIAEPVVGATLGCVPPVEGYFKAVRRVCDRHGALLIFDEVMCGSGRIGPNPSLMYPKPLHAWQDPVIGVVPDIMTMAKSLAGGYDDLAAMLLGKRVVDVLQRGSGIFSHGQTFQASPKACRAGLEVQRIIDEGDLIANVRQQGALLGRLLKEKLGLHHAVGDIRGQGLFWGIEFVAEKRTKEPFAPADAVAQRIHELGEDLHGHPPPLYPEPTNFAAGLAEPYNIMLYPGTGTADGRRGDHVLLAPPYIVTKTEIQEIVDITALVITDFFKSFSSNRRLHEDSRVQHDLSSVPDM